VTLKLYDILGKEKAVLVNERKDPGNYVFEFKNLNLSSGVYFYTLKVNEFAQTKKMVILK
ncbi:MAG: T9SS type A sorting domain-containing protein, partial [Bacteroidota bacterium]|nr:T9SS type A sorting domain-containing protein [Bacteroidota bacterium]